MGCLYLLVTNLQKASPTAIMNQMRMTDKDGKKREKMKVRDKGVEVIEKV